LGDKLVRLHADHFFVDNQLIRGIFFRSPPDSFFSRSFVEEDQRFCDAEIRAVWLAALHLKSILAINQYEAEVWFQGACWPIWRHKLINFKDIIPISPYFFGDIDIERDGSWFWHPYANFHPREPPNPIIRQLLGSALVKIHQPQKNIAICGNIIEGKENSTIQSIMLLLKEMGINFSEIITDINNHLVYINTLPRISDEKIVNKAVNIISREFYEHMLSG